MHGTKLHGTKLHITQLHGKQLHGTQLHGTQLHSTQLHGKQLHGTQLHGTRLDVISLTDFVKPILGKAPTRCTVLCGTLSWTTNVSRTDRRIFTTLSQVFGSLHRISQNQRSLNTALWRVQCRWLCGSVGTSDWRL